MMNPYKLWKNRMALMAILFVAFLLFASCERFVPGENAGLSITATPRSIGVTSPTNMLSTSTSTVLVPFTPSPTARVFVRADNCNSPGDDGHIFF
jgi:hypothetical protein